MSGKARRVPLAHLHNGVPASEDASGFPQARITLCSIYTSIGDALVLLLRTVDSDQGFLL